MRNLMISLMMIASIGGSVLAMSAPQVTFAADTVTVAEPKCNKGGFLGFPAWYDGLTNADCSIKSPSSGELSNFIWRIVLNLVSIALVAASYVAAYFILYGGFLFLTSQGDANNAAKARSTMLDAVIGLAISMGAVAFVNFIASKIGF